MKTENKIEDKVREIEDKAALMGGPRFTYSLQNDFLSLMSGGGEEFVQHYPGWTTADFKELYIRLYGEDP